MSVACRGPPGGRSSRFDCSVLTRAVDRKEPVKSVEETMNVLEAYDLTRSLRAAGELAGCSMNTVARYVDLRDRGLLPDGVEPPRRDRVIDPFMAKIEEWVERSNGKVRADVAFDKLAGLGFGGSERTVRRAVAEVKLNHR